MENKNLWMGFMIGTIIFLLMVLLQKPFDMQDPTISTVVLIIIILSGYFLSKKRMTLRGVTAKSE